MRKLYVLVAVVGALSGCHQCGGKKAHTGWRFEVNSPPYIDTSVPVLVQQQPGTMTGQPMGVVSGPVGGGEHYYQAPPQTIPSCVPPQQRPARQYYAPAADPCDPTSAPISRAEFRELLRALGAPKNGMDPERLPRPKSAPTCPESE